MIVDIPIKLIDPATDLSHLKPLKWDVVINNCPYYVAHIPGYVHTLRGWGEPIDLWAWPRSEQPSYENLIQYNLRSPVAWGLEYVKKNYLYTKYGETEAVDSSRTVITRNGELFYTIYGDKSYSIPKALVLIEDVQEHPIPFNEINYEEEIINRKILYKNQPAIITDYIKGQCCVIIVPDGKQYFENVNEIYDDEPCDSLKIDILNNDNIWWWRD